jgi:hypothetical protein
MLVKSWDTHRENIASLVLIEVWAARQHRPAWVISSGPASARNQWHCNCVLDGDKKESKSN